MRSVCWFRNDLRVLDNPALHNACLNSEEVIGVYLTTFEQWAKQHDAQTKINFWFRNLENLKVELAKLNIPLVVLDAGTFDKSPEVLWNFLNEHQAQSLYFNNEYPVYELERDRKIYHEFREQGIGVHNYHDQVIHQPGSLKTTTGNNFSVYSPFKKKWFAELDSSQLDLLPIPQPKNEIAIQSSDLTKYLSEATTEQAQYWQSGENFIQEHIDNFLKTKGSAYKEERNFPNIEATSMLSPYLNSGIVSSKWCLTKAQEYNQGFLDEGDKGIVHWVSEILWREFYRHILYNFPKVSRNEPFISYTKNIPWRESQEDLEKWKEGKTGIPIVDAGMREMLATGWMHNRTRMIVAMFLSKNLLINWQEGEKHFMEHLVDGDLASNNGGWQWSASTGTDAAPYFRIMNPETQSMRFDPDGKYIKKWIPELADCPISQIHMPENPEQYGYPKAMVDLKESRQRAIDVFSEIKG